MNLADLRANHDFSQWSLNDEGIPRPSERTAISGWRCCLSTEREREVRVQQPPKSERSLALKNRAEREKRQIH